MLLCCSRSMLLKDIGRVLQEQKFVSRTVYDLDIEKDVSMVPGSRDSECIATSEVSTRRDSTRFVTNCSYNPGSFDALPRHEKSRSKVASNQNS